MFGDGRFTPVVLLAMATSVLALLIGTCRHLLFCALHRYHAEDTTRKTLESVQIPGGDLKSVRSLSKLEVPGSGAIRIDRVELSETIQTLKRSSSHNTCPFREASRSHGNALTKQGSAPADITLSLVHGTDMAEDNAAKSEHSTSKSCEEVLSNPESQCEQ